MRKLRIPGLFAQGAQPPNTPRFVMAWAAPLAHRWALVPRPARLPVFAVSPSDPRAGKFRASLPQNGTDLATNEWFALLLEFKENGFQNLKKTNKQNPLIYKKFMSEACWTLRSICCQVVCPSFCQQTQHTHLGLDDRLTGMLVRCLSRDVTHCDWGKKKPTKTQTKNKWLKMSQVVFSYLSQCWKQLPFGKFSNSDYLIVL